MNIIKFKRNLLFNLDLLKLVKISVNNRDFCNIKTGLMGFWYFLI